MGCYFPKTFTPRTYARWLYQFVDRYNFGHRDPTDKIKKFRYTRTYIQQCFENQLGSRVKLKCRDLEEHLSGSKLHYFTSKWDYRRGDEKVSLMMLDVDAKTGQTDAPAVVDWVRDHYLPGVYADPSSNGIGRNIYFFILIGGIEIEEVRYRLKRVGTAFKVLAAEQGFDAPIDKIFGIYGTRDFTNRGLLAKMPLPTTAAEFFHLTHTTFCSWGHLQQVIDDFNALQIAKGHPEDRLAHVDGTSLPSAHTSNSIDSIAVAIKSPRLTFSATPNEDVGRLSKSGQKNTKNFSPTLSSSSPSSFLSPSTSLPLQNKIGCTNVFESETALPQQGIWSHPKLQSPDSRTRKLKLVWCWMTLKNRPATTDDIDEILDAYVTHCRHGNRSTEVRKQKLLEAVSLAAPLFKPKSGPPWEAGKYLALVKELVPEFYFKWHRRHKLTHQKLADFIQIKVRDGFAEKEAYEGRASRDATIELSRTLKKHGVINWVLDQAMHKRLLDIAMHFKLLDIYEPHIAPLVHYEGKQKGQRVVLNGVVSKGMGRLIGPGTALPEEYAKFQPIINAIRLKHQTYKEA